MDYRHSSEKKIGWVILFNLIITIAEYIGGILSGSLALISDAGHNLTDVISLILGYFGEKFSHKEPTKKHTFGFKRIEVITALINSVSLLGIGIYIIYEAITRLNSAEIIDTKIMLGVAAIGLIGNLVSVLVLHKEKDTNLNTKAAFLHLFFDTLSSVIVVAVGIIIYFTNLRFLDLAASFVISMIVLYSGFEILKKTIHILMQGIPENIDFEEVYKKLNSINNVRSVHGLHIWSIDSNEIFLSCHVCIDKKNNNQNEIIKKINSMLKKEYEINHTSIQVENENICKNKKVCN